MKVVTQTNASTSKNAQLLPLIPTAATERTKDNSVQLELMTDPANAAASPKYKMMVFVLNGDEDIRTVITWQQDLKKVLHGLNITQPLNMIHMTESLLKGTALMLFRNACTALMTARHEAAAVAAQAAAGAAANAGQLIRDQDLNRHVEMDDVIDAIREMITKILP